MLVSWIEQMFRSAGVQEEAVETVTVTLGAKWEKQEGEIAILQVNC